MKLERQLPPNYEEIAKVLAPQEHTCFTYGDTLYAPSLKEDQEIPDHLWVHEEVHAKQQTDPKAWWERYLQDPEFRFAQELEAYGAQYAYAKSKNLPEKLLRPFLERIASDLASPQYGLNMNQAVVESKIRNRAKEI